MPLQINETLQDIRAIHETLFAGHTLDAISGAGCIYRPHIAFVFINPTYRNIATNPSWSGLKAPWIGCREVWQLYADADLIDRSLNSRIQRARSDWSPEFAVEVYEHFASRGLYMTNIVKWAGLDATLPDAAKVNVYAPILIKELEILKPRYIVCFGELTYKGILRAVGTKPCLKFTASVEDMLMTNEISAEDTPLGQVIPCYLPLGQGIRNRPKAVQIVRMINAEAV